MSNKFFTEFEESLNRTEVLYVDFDTNKYLATFANHPLTHESVENLISWINARLEGSKNNGKV